MSFPRRFDAERGLDHVRGPGFDVTVSRQGAELIGLTWRHPRFGPVPLLWRNGLTDPPPRFWKDHAPILFPIVGGIHHLKSVTTGGQKIWFKKHHGFVRHSTLELINADLQAGSAELAYRLAANDETLSMYPWLFTLDVVYEVHPEQLQQTITVTNLDDEPLPFQLGWHPGFNTPLRRGEKSGCRLRLPQGRLRLMANDEQCHLTGQCQEIDGAGDFAFTETGLSRTYMFDVSGLAPEARVVELLNPDESLGVRLRFGDYPHLGVWSDANAPFICLEAWQGMDDSAVQEPFDRKFGMVLLPPGQSDTRRVTIEVIS